jgi:hypothetical protein
MSGNKAPGKELRKVVVDGLEIGEIEPSGDMLEDIKRASALVDKAGLGKRGSKHPAYSIYRQAAAFSVASKHIHTTFLAKPQVNPVGFPTFVVNSVLAIELFLKTLHKLAGRDARGHDLAQLYETLPQELKDAIAAHGKLLLSRFPNEKLGDIPSMLAKLRRAFEQWRYMYEHKTLHVDLPPMIFLLVLLHNVCKEKLPK